MFSLMERKNDIIFEITNTFSETKIDLKKIKEKTVKSNTKHRLTWSHYLKHNFDGTPATYKYWDVKDKSKMIICGIALDYLNYIFPELEYQFDH